MTAAGIPGGAEEAEKRISEHEDGRDRRTAVCQHGSHVIYQRPGQDWWEDEAGWTTCVKAPAIGEHVGHKPMHPPASRASAATVTGSDTGGLKCKVCGVKQANHR